MSFRYGGWAGLQSVNFQSDNYTVHAIQEKNGINVKYTHDSEKRKILSSLDDYLSKIPFIRGIWLLLYGVLNQWKLMLSMIPVAIILSYIFIKYAKINELNEISKISNSIFLLILLIYVFIFGIFMKFSNMSKYHAAEHMSGNAFDNLNSIDLKDIKIQSRVHRRCGTNLFVYIVSIMILLSFFMHPFILVFCLSVSFGYEVFRLKDNLLKRYLFPFYWIGRVCQYLFFTSKPNDKHLKVAQVALQKLIDLENDN